MLKRSMGKSALMVALITGNVIWGGSAVYAEEGLQQFNLDQMVVTATRTMKELQEVPSSINVVTAKEIAEKNVTSVQEALQYLPGIYMNQSAQGSIQMRGFNSSDILVLVDGVQMNDTYDGSVNFNMIPVENIECIEVLRGAASSIYGGHAVGGIINIITKEAKEGTHVDAALSYGSNSTWKKSLNVNSKINDKWSFGIGYENRKSDGYDGYYVKKSGKASSSTGTVANLPVLSNGQYIVGGRGTKDWEHENYAANIKYNFDDSKSLKYAYSKYETEFSYKDPFTYVKDANGRPVWSGTVITQDGTNFTIKPSDFLGYENINERDTHSLVYKDEDNNFSAIFSYLNDKKSGYSSASSSADSVDWKGEGNYSSHPGKIYNFALEKAWGNIGKHSIVVGANFKQEEMTQDRYALKNWKDHDSKTEHYAQDKGKVKNFAVYVQDEYKLSDPVTMYLGARIDHYIKGSGSFWSTATGSEYNTTSKEETYNELSPKIAFDYEADNNTNYYISYGHSFNPPEMYKIYRYSEFSSYWYVPNPELDPETSNTFEIGMKKKLNNNTDFSVTLYHVDTDDKIAASGILPGEAYMGKNVKKYINFDSEERNGVEFEINHKFSDKFNGYFNYSWQKGTLKSKGEESTNFEIPKHLLHVGLAYDCDKWNVLLNCQYVSARQAPDDVTGEYGAEDAYFIVNTAFNYEIAKGTILQFGINNLFDKEFYASEATSGRTYNVGLRYSF